MKSKIKVISVQYGKGKPELISAQIKTKYWESQKIVVAYVPPKTKQKWTKEKHEEIVEDILENLEKIIKISQRVILVWNFNCSGVKLETFKRGDENTWGNELLRLMVNNTMVQWRR